MTRRSRYVLAGAAVFLLVALAGGLIAYFGADRLRGRRGLPPELQYVPADASVVAFADVRKVMNSQLRRELESLAGSHTGRQRMHEFAGIDLERDVSHVVVFFGMDGARGNAGGLPDVLVLAAGRYDQPRIEQFLEQRGASRRAYRGRSLFSRAAPDGRGEMAVAFVRPDLVAMGPGDSVERTLDRVDAPANTGPGDELMKRVREVASDDAWIVSRFEALVRRLPLPPAVGRQMPPLRFLTASARVDGGVTGVVRAETADEAAGQQLRDLIRGAVAVARMQAGSRPELQEALKSVELGGSGPDVRLSFAITPETIRAAAPPRRPRPPAP